MTAADTAAHAQPDAWLNLEPSIYEGCERITTDKVTANIWQAAGARVVPLYRADALTDQLAKAEARCGELVKALTVSKHALAEAEVEIDADASPTTWLRVHSALGRAAKALAPAPTARKGRTHERLG